jgi:hypothetical protein
MQDEVREGRLADVTVDMRPLELTDEQVAALAALPNVAAVEPRSSVEVRVLVGERRAPARVIGIRDFASQGVDVLRVESGAFPGPRELLADVHANVGVYDGRAGDSLTVLSAGGERAEFTVSGRGRTLPSLRRRMRTAWGAPATFYEATNRTRQRVPPLIPPRRGRRPSLR